MQLGCSSASIPMSKEVPLDPRLASRGRFGLQDDVDRMVVRSRRTPLPRGASERGEADRRSSTMRGAGSSIVFAPSPLWRDASK